MKPGIVLYAAVMPSSVMARNSLECVPWLVWRQGKEERFQEAFDVVLVGYGFAGAAAAIEASDRGARTAHRKMPDPGAPCGTPLRMLRTGTMTGKPLLPLV